MNHTHIHNHDMGLQDFFTWRSQAVANTTFLDDEVPADIDEPPDRQILRAQQAHADFHKSTVRPTCERKESLLTRALTKLPEPETTRPHVHVATDMSRRRSILSNASLASTAELTSDGGLTSPARTNTPSPPLPNNHYPSFAPYLMAQKTHCVPEPSSAQIEPRRTVQTSDVHLAISPKAEAPVAVAPQKQRRITFACGGWKDTASKSKDVPVVEQKVSSPAVVAPPKRACTIKFACPGPKPEAKVTQSKVESQEVVQASKPPVETPKRSSRSPVAARKSPRTTQPSRAHRDSSSTARRHSQSPVAVRAKPKYIVVDEKALDSSDATRFHEFASEKLEDDDWIRKDSDVTRTKLTINDTLKKENAIRRLGDEAEEEALQDEDDDCNDSDENDYNENDDEEEEDDEDEDDEDEEAYVRSSDDGISDGNETDNEAGFADSDESDVEGEFAFWTPGRALNANDATEASTYRASAHRTASTSSIDSLNHMSPPKESRKLRRRPIKIRPGTPDLPDSTDFVCGTLDEDRPLEDAYVSCMEARKNARHRRCPQDIDPSFPTSDPENEEDEDNTVDTVKSSDEHVWLHGKFEDSEDDSHGRRRSTVSRRKSPAPSPRRLHSPPPARRLHSPPPPKQRLRSPPPRKLFGGQSPRRLRSPPPARTIRSPAASPTSHATSAAAIFAPLGLRPGLTHTKSLPRTPNIFAAQYRASRYAAANCSDGSDTFDGHIRGAIDIVKGLERKRQRRKEKFHQKQNNRKGKEHLDRRPQPGKGAERMRELGLLIAGSRAGVQDPYMMSA